MLGFGQNSSGSNANSSNSISWTVAGLITLGCALAAAAVKIVQLHTQSQQQAETIHTLQMRLTYLNYYYPNQPYQYRAKRHNTRQQQYHPFVYLQRDTNLARDVPVPYLLATPHDTLCKICTERTVNRIYLPCGHTVCQACLRQYVQQTYEAQPCGQPVPRRLRRQLPQNCPFCRSRVRAVNAVFFS